MFLSPNKHPRGFLSPINRVLIDTAGLNLSIIWAGTALTMLDADSIHSNIGKERILDRIIEEYEPELNPREWIESLIDTSGCEEVWDDPKVNSYELVGRKRLAGRVIMYLSTRETSESPSSKVVRLRRAIKLSIEKHHNAMYNKLLGVCRERIDVCDAIRQMVIASVLSDGKVSFPPYIRKDNHEATDLVHIGICQLTLDREESKWILAEPLAIRTCI